KPRARAVRSATPPPRPAAPAQGEGPPREGPHEGELNARSNRLQERMAVPVLLAALASVPAVFLTLLDEPARSAGTLINTLSGAVIVAEVVVLFAVSDRKSTRLNSSHVKISYAVFCL